MPDLYPLFSLYRGWRVIPGQVSCADLRQYSVLQINASAVALDHRKLRFNQQMRFVRMEGVKTPSMRTASAEAAELGSAGRNPTTSVLTCWIKLRGRSVEAAYLPDFIPLSRYAC
jgi:hypothetical protein